MPSKTIMTSAVQLLFQVLAFYGVVELNPDEHLAITAGLLAAAGIFQRMATAKAIKAASQ